MTVVRGRFSNLLVPGARKVFVDDYNELPADYQSVFNVENSEKAYEDDLVMTGLPAAPGRGEGEEIIFDRPVFRGRVRYLHTGYGLGFEITREAVEDDLYGALVNRGARNLARSMRETESITAWNILNNAFSSVLVYDGQPLIDENHTGVGNLLFSNDAGATDLSTAALKAATENFMRMQNDRGLRVSLMPTNLIVPVENWWTANEILGTQVITGAASGGETDSIISNYVENVVTMMGLTPMKSPFLTDPNSWYLTAPKSQHKMNFMWRTSPQETSGDDDRAQVAWYGIVARWSTGASDWRGVFGGQGSS
jgi:phage major head subunit gpT-like protein